MHMQEILIYHKYDTKKAIHSNSMSRNVLCGNPILTARSLNFIYHYTCNKMPQPNYTENLLKFCVKEF